MPGVRFLSRTAAAIVLLAATFLAIVLVVFRAGSPDREIGRRAPEFLLPDRSGRQVSLGGVGGRAVIVNFWATWCPPCVAETPSLEALHRALGKRGLVVLGISVDEDRQAVEKFVADQGVTYPVLLDPKAETPRRYGTRKYPESFLLGADGRIRQKYVGPINWTDQHVRAEIEKLL